MKNPILKPSQQNLYNIWLEEKLRHINPQELSASDKRVADKFLNEPKAERIRILKEQCNGLPHHFYKYLAHPFITTNEEEIKEKKRRLESILLHNQLFLSSHTDFNDPFDVYPHYKKDCGIKDIRQYVINSMKILDNNPKPSESQISIHTHQISQNVAQFTENLISNLRQACANTGIFCATTDAENILMWSHYTNYHQGICIEFDNTEDIEMATLFQQVEYQTNNMRPVINPYISSTPDDYDVYNLHKASAWKYENEWRIALANTKHTSMSFNPAYISKVILGVKAAQETVDYIHSINEQRKENTLPTFEIKQAYMADHEFKILH